MVRLSVFHPSTDGWKTDINAFPWENGCKWMIIYYISLHPHLSTSIFWNRSKLYFSSIKKGIGRKTDVNRQMVSFPSIFAWVLDVKKRMKTSCVFSLKRRDWTDEMNGPHMGKGPYQLLDDYVYKWVYISPVYTLYISILGLGPYSGGCFLL